MRAAGHISENRFRAAHVAPTENRGPLGMQAQRAVLRSAPLPLGSSAQLPDDRHTHLAIKQEVSASTQNQAFAALLFPYRHVLGREVGDLGDVIRARKSRYLPVVMTQEEVKAVLRCLAAAEWRWQWVFPQDNRWRNADTREEARHHLEAGYAIRTVQELLGHQDVPTTRIYTHVLNRGGRGVRSPADTL